MGEAREAAALARKLGARHFRDLAEAFAAAPAALIDAAHPCEPVAPALTARAALRRRIPVLRFRRPPWSPGAQDRWIPVASALEARAALGPAHRRPFLCLGPAERMAFANDPERAYLIRIRSGAAPPPHSRATVLDAPGPYDAAGEAALMDAQGVDILVARNAGGEGAWPKIEAARRLGIPVVMLGRPPAVTQEAARVADAAAWLRGLGLS